MINENNIGTKGNMGDIYTDLMQFRELISSRGELYYNLQKLATTNIELRNVIKNKSFHSIHSNEEEKHNFERNLENTAADLMASFHEIFRNAKMLLSNNDNCRNNCSINRDLLIMTLDLIINITTSYKQRLLENYNEGDIHDREINTITRLLRLISVIINLFSNNKVALVENNLRQIDNIDTDNKNKVSERLLYLEDKLKGANKEIFSLNKELDSAKLELECLLLCQDSGLSRTEYNKIFTENIEATLYKKELESLQKQYLEFEQINASLEHKIVNLLNEVNTLVTKNYFLEERLKQLKKPNQEKMSINSVKHLTKNDLMIQIKEQNETIHNMAAQNSQLNAILIQLKKDNKFCSKSYIISRSKILEREIQNMKLEHNLQEQKLINGQLDMTISGLERKIEELEMERYKSGRKIEELFVQLAASEAIRISLQLNVNNDNKSFTKTNALIYEREQYNESTCNEKSLHREISESTIDNNNQSNMNQNLEDNHSKLSDSAESEIPTSERMREE